MTIQQVRIQIGGDDSDCDQVAADCLYRLDRDVQRSDADARDTRVERTGALEKLLGNCNAMRNLRVSIRKVVYGDERLRDGAPSSILVTGETGTGKELVARALHFEGPRRDQPFVEINCASIPALLLESELFGHERGAFTDAKSRKLGLVETADGGTLFLDEIGDMDLALQAKLLRLLESRCVRRVGALRDQPVDIRIIAATHRPLASLVAEGRFRADLFFRLRTIQLAIPALRDRGEDIEHLAEHYLALHASRYDREGMTLSAAARSALLHHRWPGNVRELRNVMEHAVLMSSTSVVESVDLDALPVFGAASTGTPSAASSMTLEQMGGEALQRALASSRWNVSRAARTLGISRDALRYRIEKYGLSVRD